MGKKYILCEECGRFNEATSDSNIFGAELIVCTDCGEKRRVVELRNMTCKRCGNTFYAKKKYFSGGFVCPLCDDPPEEEHDHTSSPAAPRLAERTDAHSIPHSDVLGKYIHEDFEPVEGVHCPVCRGPLIYRGGRPYCATDRKYIDPDEVERQLADIVVTESSRRSAPKPIDWPENDMRASRRLMMPHGWSGRIPWHSSIIVGEHQILIYAYAGGTMYKTEGRYAFFDQNIDDDARAHALYTGEYLNKIQDNTSIIFVSLYVHDLTTNIDDIKRLDIAGVKYSLSTTVCFSFRIDNPKTLCNHHFTFNEKDEDYLNKMIVRWMKQEISKTVKMEVDRHFADLPVTMSVNAETIQDSVNSSFILKYDRIRDAANRELHEKYGIAVENISNISFTVTTHEFCPICDAKLIMAANGRSARCDGDIKHEFTRCKSCGTFGVLSGSRRCENCGVDFCLTCGSPVIKEGDHIVCTGDPRHTFYRCSFCDQYSVPAGEKVCIAKGCGKYNGRI